MERAEAREEGGEGGGRSGWRVGVGRWEGVGSGGWIPALKQCQTHTYRHTCTHTHMHAHTNARTHTCTHTYTHMYVSMYVSLYIHVVSFQQDTVGPIAKLSSMEPPPAREGGIRLHGLTQDGNTVNSGRIN